MFHSFFPRPRLYFISFVVWGLFCVIAWFVVGRDLGSSLSLGNIHRVRLPRAACGRCRQGRQGRVCGRPKMGGEHLVLSIPHGQLPCLCRLLDVVLATQMELVVRWRFSADRIRDLVSGPGRRHAERMVRPVLQHHPEGADQAQQYPAGRVLGAYLDVPGHRHDLHGGGRPERLLHEALHLPLAHRHERLLHGALGQSCATSKGPRNASRKMPNDLPSLPKASAEGSSMQL